LKPAPERVRELHEQLGLTGVRSVGWEGYG